MTPKAIRFEHHRVPWGTEVYAIIDDVYDPADQHPLAGVGSTEAEAVADLKERLAEMAMTTCENCEGEGRFHRNIVDGWDYWDEGEEWVACPVCGGRGWVVDADPPPLEPGK